MSALPNILRLKGRDRATEGKVYKIEILTHRKQIPTTLPDSVGPNPDSVRTDHFFKVLNCYE
jgi:hypothetical protein